MVGMDEQAKPRKALKGSLGVLGALITIVSVWWFALRPRRKPSDD